MDSLTCLVLSRFSPPTHTSGSVVVPSCLVSLRGRVHCLNKCPSVVCPAPVPVSCRWASTPGGLISCRPTCGTRRGWSSWSVPTSASAPCRSCTATATPWAPQTASCACRRWTVDCGVRLWRSWPVAFVDWRLAAAWLCLHRWESPTLRVVFALVVQFAALGARRVHRGGEAGG
jgi:hypothetical protein